MLNVSERLQGNGNEGIRVTLFINSTIRSKLKDGGRQKGEMRTIFAVMGLRWLHLNGKSRSNIVGVQLAITHLYLFGTTVVRQCSTMTTKMV